MGSPVSLALGASLLDTSLPFLPFSSEKKGRKRGSHGYFTTLYTFTLSTFLSLPLSLLNGFIDRGGGMDRVFRSGATFGWMNGWDGMECMG